MATSEEVLITFFGKDDVSSTASQIDSNVQSMASSISSALSNLNSGFMNLSIVSNNLISSLNNGKSASELIFGTSSKAETNKVLLNNMTETKEAAEELYATVDSVTDKSLTSMQDLIPAMNAFKAATAASDEEMNNITDDMANFGAAVLAQTGSTELAETAMMNLSKGIKGAFASLDQYGVSEDALMRTGLWTGKEDDVEGYMAAVTEVIGSTEELMETNEGLDAKIGKAFSRAGKKIGNEFLPFIKDVKRGFLDLDDSLGGNLTASILVLSEGIDVANNAFFNLSTTVRGFEDIHKAITVLKNWGKTAEDIAESASNATSAVKGMSDAMDTASNVSGMASAGSDVASTGADAGKSVSKTEKAVDGATTGLFAADIIKGNKDSKKNIGKAKKSIEVSTKELDSLYDSMIDFDNNKKKAIESYKSIFNERNHLLDEKAGLISELDNIDDLFKTQDISKYESAIAHATAGFGDADLVAVEAFKEYTGSYRDSESKILSLIKDAEKSNANINKAKLEYIANSEKRIGEIDEALSHFKGLDKLNMDEVIPDIEFKSSKLDKIDDSLTSTMSKFGPKQTNESTKTTNAIEKFKLAIVGEGNALKGLGKQNKKVQEEAKEALESFTDYTGLFDDKEVMKEWEKSERGISNVIKDGGSKLKNGFTSAFSSLKSLPQSLKGSLKSVSGSFKGLGGSIKNAFGSLKNIDFRGISESIGGKFQSGLLSLAGLPRKLSSSLKSTGSSMAKSLKEGLSGLDKSLYQSIDNFSIKDTFSNLKDKLSGLKGAKEITDGVEEVAEVGTAVGAVAPEMEAAAAGAETAAVAETTLAGAFTSMIVPALALAAVIIIMIPIAAVIAAEAMIFIRALAEVMEALDFDSVNLDGAVEGLKSIATALLYVAAAMGALVLVSIFTNLLSVTSFFTGLKGPLESAKESIIEAAEELGEFSTVSVDPSVATNLQNIGESLKAVGDAMMGLTSIVALTGFTNFLSWAFQFGSISSAMEQAKTEIMDAANKLNEFAGLEPLDEAVANNIQNVCDSLASVGNAMEALRSIRDGENWDGIFQGLMNGLFDGVNIQQALDNVKQDVYDASVALKDWNNLEEIPEDTSEKIQRVSDALSAMSQAFETLRGFRDNGVWDQMMDGISRNGVDIGTALNNVKTDLETAANTIKSMNVDGVDESKIEGIKNVGSALTEVSTIMSTLSSMPSMEGFDAESITTAVTNVQTAADALSGLNNIVLGEGVDGVLGTIQTALTTLRETLSSLSEGFATPATSIGTGIVNGVKSGLSPLTPAVTGAVDSATGTAASNGWTGGSRIGTSTTNGFKSALKLAEAMSTEMTYVKQAVDNGISEAKTAAQNGAAEVVQAFKNGIETGSPGAMAWATYDEMWFIHDFIVSEGKHIVKTTKKLGESMVTAFGNPSLGIGLDKLSSINGNLSMEQLQSLQLANTTAPNNPGDGKTINIYFNEGAIPVKVGSLTPTEAQQIFLAATEELYI